MQNFSNKNSKVNILKKVWSKEKALKENALSKKDAKAIQGLLLAYLEKILPRDSMPRLRFKKLCSQRRFQTWWSDSNGYPVGNPWDKIEPFLGILQQYEAEKTIKNRLETEGLFVESRSQDEDQHLLIGPKDGSGDKARVVIDGKTGEIRVEDNQKEPTELVPKIETFLTLPNGKKIKTTREAIENN